MTVGSSKEMMKPMEEELSIYNERIKKIFGWHVNISSLVKQMPAIPLDYEPSHRGLALIRISLFLINCIESALQAMKAFKRNWEDNNLVMISLPIRLSFEIWGASHYSLKLAMKIIEENNIEWVLEKTEQLTIGARSNIELPWGGTTKIKSIHIHDFIRSLEDVLPSSMNTYDFLCESCHPSFLSFSSWLLIGSKMNNYQNQKFREKMHKQIDKTLLVLEESLNGIKNDVSSFTKIALPYLKEKKKNKHTLCCLITL